jgi:O-antigen/teichoic acid export membrane protein
MIKRALQLNIYSIASNGAILITGVLFSVILTRILSVGDYGLLTSFVSFVAFITMFSDMGLRTTATKYIGDALFSKNKNLWLYITKLAALRVSLVALLGILIFAFAGQLAGAVLHSPDYAVVFQITAVAAVIFAVMNFFEGLISAANRYEYTFAGSAIVSVGRLVLPIMAAMLIAPTAEWAMVGVGLGYLAGAVAYLVFFKRTYSGFAPDWSGHLPAGLKSYAMYAALIMLASAFLMNFDTVLLNAFLSPQSVALYKAAQMVLIGVISLAPISYGLIFTLFVELESTGKRNEQQEAYAKAAKYALAFFIPISFMMFVLAPEIIGFFYLPTYAASASALRAFAFLPVFYFFFNMNMSTLLARSEMKIAGALYLLAAVCSLGLNLLLIPQFGFVGSAMAYAAAFIIPTIISIPMLARRLALSVHVREIVRPLAVSVVASAAVFLVQGTQAVPWVVLLFLFPLVCAGLYLLMLDADDRHIIGLLQELFLHKGQGGEKK